MEGAPQFRPVLRGQVAYGRSGQREVDVSHLGQALQSFQILFESRHIAADKRPAERVLRSALRIVG